MSEYKDVPGELRSEGPTWTTLINAMILMTQGCIVWRGLSAAERCFRDFGSELSWSTAMIFRLPPLIWVSFGFGLGGMVVVVSLLPLSPRVSRLIQNLILIVGFVAFTAVSVSVLMEVDRAWRAMR